MMTGSRRFLLFLVLACVTCVVLVQISMDDIMGRSNPPHQHYEEERDKGPEALPNIATNPATARKQTSTTIKTASPPSSTTKKIIIKPTEPNANSRPTNQLKINQTTEPKAHPVDISKKTYNIEAKVQVRRLPLAETRQLVNRQDRIQEILKQGRTIQRRPTLDPMRSLKSIPVADPDKVQRIFIITYFRAGSSFFGDILQQNWKTFYHFEPLHSMTYDKRINDTKIPEVFSLFNSIFRCNFSEARDYMQWVKKSHNQFLFAHNLFLWATCHNNPRTCFNPGFVNAACVRAPIHVMKVTRLHMRHLRSYLEDNPYLNIKVVYLTRDPRGIVSSRWSLDWCNATNCSDSGVLCREMDEDLAIFNDLQRQQPSNFIKVRYEDLALNPELETQKLLGFLQLPFSPLVKKFLKTHTISSRKSDDKNPYSTRRNSSSMVRSWLERFTYKQIVDVQSQCEDVLYKLNHSLIVSANQLPYPNGKVKQNVSPQPNQDMLWRFNKNPIAKKYLSDKKEYSLNRPDYLNNHPNVFNSNNTNIEIHKTYKVVESYTGKNTPIKIAHLPKEYPIT